jgi:serine/threonine protein kinase
MEYADGGTLRNYLKKNFDDLTWENKYNLAHQLACTILYMHDKGIVHRELVILLIIRLLNLNILLIYFDICFIIAF